MQDSATINDFGQQWLRFRDNSGYYGSVELLRDILEPLVTIGSLQNKHVADIGSGTGRIVNMLLDAGVASVVAVEPSDAFKVLVENTATRKEKITYLNTPGDGLASAQPLDYVFSIGVVHHIPEPRSTIQAAYRSLAPGGSMMVWLYGKEGNELYLALVLPLRALSRLVPDRALSACCYFLDLLLQPYIMLARILPVPMRRYFLDHYARLSPSKRRLTLFDQLNPTYAKYYTKSEAEELLSREGFVNVRVFHRHGYSWSVIGTKPSS